MENIFGKIIISIGALFSGLFGESATLTTNVHTIGTETKVVATTEVKPNPLAQVLQQVKDNTSSLAPSSVKDIVTASVNNALYNDTEVTSKLQKVDGDKVYSKQELLALAGPKPTKLPLGDKKYTTDAPKKGYIYLCNARSDEMGGGAGNPGPWIRDGYWYPNEKISISGDVSWPNATFKNTVTGLYRYLTGNGLPINHTTGIYPVQSTDAAYKYDRNPNSIKTQNMNEKYSASPTISTNPTCMTGEVGTMLTGIPLFNAFDAQLRDAVAYEVQDHCDGHPQVSGQYHYHSNSDCFTDESIETTLGFAFDGFPITGGKVAEGKYLTTDDLDICHGITSEIVVDGKRKTMYHYVMTPDFPYSVSCFRGTPNHTNAGPQMERQQNQQLGGKQQQGQGGQGGTPPQFALDACTNKTVSSRCSMQTPEGTLTGACNYTPDQKYFACIPSNR